VQKAYRLLFDGEGEKELPGGGVKNSFRPWRFKNATASTIKVGRCHEAGSQNCYNWEALAKRGVRYRRTKNPDL